MASVVVKALSTPQQVRQARKRGIRRSASRPSVSEMSPEQRCSNALRYAIRGLDCIVGENRKPPPDEPAPASPLKPIPMPYTTLNENKA